MPYKNITHGICDGCAAQVSANSMLLESIDAPVLLMQGNPRQVITANKKALELFGKELHEVENHRGGEVFDCIHSFTEAGWERMSTARTARSRMRLSIHLSRQILKICFDRTVHKKAHRQNLRLAGVNRKGGRPGIGAD
jgi:transcriptional regulator of aromatic amino acid metabolism